MVWYSHRFIWNRLSQTLLLLNKHTHTHHSATMRTERTHTHNTHLYTTLCSCRKLRKQRHSELRESEWKYHEVIRGERECGLLRTQQRVSFQKNITSHSPHLTEWICGGNNYFLQKWAQMQCRRNHPPFLMPFLWCLVKIHSFRRTRTSIVLLGVPSPSLRNSNVNQRL